MIRKLQNRFVRIAVLVLTAAMVTVVGIINTANLIIVRSELAGTVRELAENSIPERGPKDDGKEPAFPQSCQRIRLVHRLQQRGRGTQGAEPGRYSGPG